MSTKRSPVGKVDSHDECSPLGKEEEPPAKKKKAGRSTSWRRTNSEEFLKLHPTEVEASSDSSSGAESGRITP